MVAIYSELLQRRFGAELGATGNEYIGRTIEGALRMENLLRALRTYTQVLTTNPEPARRNRRRRSSEKDAVKPRVTIKDSGASVTSTRLPRIRMHAFERGRSYR